ncbi:hypothetical protein A6V36_32985 [Paraburkholderia ginsengiterrae]|uniref:PhnO n=1 Tax=Paraburkholderia ginsengiterrae TaxID=1462993 RepID=A0A1A9N3U0_9BURK|nr:DUF3579 domain-containing protein [Paraburkholderia ginsengiterrae]OAJ56830.1 hypothetical protein A6V37_30965 [Paraburkholderia ginsengiterrae]OAJ56889.1 hypothetical protein A6V36_32985 [Paraburkholderia ginsengiterrae]
MTTHIGTRHFLIKGRTVSGKTFRPGDWAERLTGVITLFVGERRPGIHIACTRLAMPVVQAELKCLLVASELQLVCPAAFEFVARFAQDNDLPMEVDGMPERDGPGTAVQSAFPLAEISAIPAAGF